MLSAKDELRHQLQRRSKKLGLTQAAIEILITRAEIVPSRRAGSRICASDDCADYVRCLVQGAAKQVCRMASGRSITIRFFGPGEFLCLPPPDHDLAYRAEVVAHSSATVALWTRGHLLEAIRAMPIGGIGQLTSWSFRHTTQLLQEKVLLSARPIHERLEHELRVLARLFGRDDDGGWILDPGVSHQDLADLVVASRARVSNALGRLARQGLVRPKGKRFVISSALLVRGQSSCRTVRQATPPVREESGRWGEASSSSSEGSPHGREGTVPDVRDSPRGGLR